MDLKVLFHHPEALSDQELGNLRYKIRMMGLLPSSCAGFTGLAMYLIDVRMLQRRHDWKRIVFAFAAGYLLGVQGTKYIK